MRQWEPEAVFEGLEATSADGFGGGHERSDGSTGGKLGLSGLVLLGVFNVSRHLLFLFLFVLRLLADLRLGPQPGSSPARPRSRSCQCPRLRPPSPPSLWIAPCHPSFFAESVRAALGVVPDGAATSASGLAPYLCLLARALHGEKWLHEGVVEVPDALRGIRGEHVVDRALDDAAGIGQDLGSLRGPQTCAW